MALWSSLGPDAASPRHPEPSFTTQPLAFGQTPGHTHTHTRTPPGFPQSRLTGSFPSHGYFCLPGFGVAGDRSHAEALPDRGVASAL